MDEPRRWWLACCGLDCGTCSIHLRTEEELSHWRDRGVDPDEIRCDGCRSDPQGHHWSPDCRILRCCLHERGLEFCSQCPDLPCAIVEQFADGYEHHAWAVKRLIEMKERGVEEWLAAHGYGR